MVSVNRLIAFQKKVEPSFFCVIENPIDLFYLTGMSLSQGTLVVGEKIYLFVDGRYFDLAKSKFNYEVKAFSELGSWIKDKKLIIDSAYTSLERAQFFEKSSTFKSASKLLKKSRLIKDLQEIKLLKKAASLTKLGIEHIYGLLKVGVREDDLAFEFESFVRKNGASALSFEPIIAFGENSAFPHHRASNSKLLNNQIVLIDVGAKVEGYSGDLTRVFSFGQIDERLQLFQKWVTQAFEESLAVAKVGRSIKELDLIARSVFAREGVEALFTHSLGHGIGLETHEFPIIRFNGLDSDEILEEGMVFTIEPGLYQVGLGGVRWEEMILVSNDGPSVL
jgi:Xaa-Pro aminopeptidase